MYNTLVNGIWGEEGMHSQAADLWTVISQLSNRVIQSIILVRQSRAHTRASPVEVDGPGDA